MHDAFNLRGKLMIRVAISMINFDTLKGVGKYAELKKGQLSYQGRIDLAQYYIVYHEIMEVGPSHKEFKGNWNVQVLTELNYYTEVLKTLFYR